jgi:DNA repair protein SbcC/Rad50
MRLHRLEIEAFGPFAGREHVDFESLTDSGLFLLCGPTGAGKTSVLDAVCFALFGQVPGERDKARRLRSDHAPAGTGPRVVLEVSLRGRRLRVTRSPEWMRPKKRGTGQIREHAKVLVEERTDGGWLQRTNRIDEAGDLVGTLLGLTMSQFCQVALLPQGRFETFLRCGAHERHALLEKLFGTHRFRAVEEWLAEHRRTVAARSAEHAQQVSGVLERVGEASGRVHADEGHDDDTAADDVSAEDALDRCDELRRETVAALTEATQARACADQRAKDARVALETARDHAELQARHRDARARDAELRALADSTDRMAGLVERARLAATVAPFIELHDAAERRKQQADQALDAARAGLPADERDAHTDVAGHGDPDAVGTVLRRRLEEVARLDALFPVQRQVAGLDEQLASLAAGLESLEAEGARLHTRATGRAPALERARSAHAEAATAAGQQASLRERRASALQLAEAAERVPEQRRRRTSLADARERAADTAQQARDRWLDLRQARLEGMAAELARDLQATHPCPVCGSSDHPAPADAGAQTVSAQTERQAEQAWHCAEQERQRHADELADCDRELAALEAMADGTDPQTAAARLAQAQEDLARAEQASARVVSLAAEVRALEEAGEEDDLLRRRLETDRAQLTERHALLTRERDELSTKLAAAVADAQTLTQRLEQARRAVRRWEQLLAALREHADATRAHGQCLRRLERALEDSGFADVAAARAATMSRTELSNTDALLRRRAEQSAQVRAVLDDPRVVEAAALPSVQLESFTAQTAAAEGARDEALARERVLEHRAHRLEHLHGDLERAVRAWQPVRTALTVAEGMAALCAGTSADNRHKMRLSAYVLAARLEQVVAAANQRLLAMSSGRYTLRHSVARGVGDRRGGLGLLVHDGWTGDLRDPATLSGGETFFTSLALALGLADVVSHEAGGTEINTLFVDEGFGSLDPDTLDEVMDVLDHLRSGGRAVGIVSHVADLRARVPAQVHVRKSRAGSTLAPAGSPRHD